MAFKNTKMTYGSMSKFLHWIIFFAVLALLIVGNFMEDISNEPMKVNVYTIHKLVGISVLILMLIRVYWTLTNPKPDLPGFLSKTIERSVHYILYLLLIIMPLSGWIMSTAANKAPSFFGLMTLPLPGIEHSKPLAKTASSIHFYVSWTIVFFVSLHILAALKHHFIDKDNILRRMMPTKRL